MGRGKRKITRKEQPSEPFISPAYQAILDHEEYLSRAALPRYRSFDEYVADHPDGEYLRVGIVSEGRQVWFFPCDAYGNGVPGGYFEGRVFTRKDGPWIVYVSDCDDTHVAKSVPTEEAGWELLNTVMTLAPVSMEDLVETFAFRYD